MEDTGGAGATASYRLEITGYLQGNWAEWFGGMAIENLPNGNTLLVGPIEDQAALNGLINKVYALGLSLVAINPQIINPRVGKERNP